MPRSAKGASRTLSEATKTLEANPEGVFTSVEVERARTAILSNLEAVKHIKEGRNNYIEVPDDATRQRAAELIIRLGCGEVTRSSSETEAQSQEDDQPKNAERSPLELDVDPELERRILQDRLAALAPPSAKRQSN